MLGSHNSFHCTTLGFSTGWPGPWSQSKLTKGSGGYLGSYPKKDRQRTCSSFISSGQSKKIRPPVKRSFPAWDLPFVLDCLMSQPFAPIESASLMEPDAQDCLFNCSDFREEGLRITSFGAEDEHISFFPDRVELRTVQGFDPKVSCQSTLSEAWALPTFTDPHSGSLQELDISIVLRVSSKLFILPWGRNRGKEAASRTIASWICKRIQKAYRARGMDPPAVKAHSTRTVSSSWAARANVSLETICKAATWSSPNTFMHHYRIDPGALTSVEFRRRAIESALSFP